MKSASAIKNGPQTRAILDRGLPETLAFFWCQNGPTFARKSPAEPVLEPLGAPWPRPGFDLKKGPFLLKNRVFGPDFDLKNPVFSTRNPEVPL